MARGPACRARVRLSRARILADRRGRYVETQASCRSASGRRAGLQNVGAGTARVDFLCDHRRKRREVEAGRAWPRKYARSRTGAASRAMCRDAPVDPRRSEAKSMRPRLRVHASVQRVDGIGVAVVIDFVGRDADLHAGSASDAAAARVIASRCSGRRHVRFLPRLAGRQQHEFGQLQHLGETPREREMAVVDRIESAAEQADPARQGAGERSASGESLHAARGSASRHTHSRGTRKSL